MKYSEDEHYNAIRDCDHDFVPLHHRILHPFADGMRCTRCGITVDEGAIEEEEEDDKYEDDIPDIIEDDDDEDTETYND